MQELGAKPIEMWPQLVEVHHIGVGTEHCPPTLLVDLGKFHGNNPPLVVKKSLCQPQGEFKLWALYQTRTQILTTNHIVSMCARKEIHTPLANISVGCSLWWQGYHVQKSGCDLKNWTAGAQVQFHDGMAKNGFIQRKQSTEQNHGIKGKFSNSEIKTPNCIHFRNIINISAFSEYSISVSHIHWLGEGGLLCAKKHTLCAKG